MTSDDDKPIPEPDPWAGLDIGNEPDADEATAFNFDNLLDEPSPAVDPLVDEQAATPPAVENPPTDAPLFHQEEPFAFEAMEQSVEEPADAVPGDIPLAVFPPPEVEAEGSDVLIGTGRSGIISIAAAAEDLGIQDFDGGDRVEEQFGDEDIAHELGLADLDSAPPATDAADSEASLSGSADFGEPVADAPAEDLAVGTGGGDSGDGNGGFPVLNSEPFEEQAEPVAEGWETEQDAAASIAFPAAATVAGGAAALAGARPAKRRGSGLGQMVGVVLGGLMALPVTYAILIWGFHKDPFKLAKKAPAQLAFLLPEKLQPGSKSTRKVEATTEPKAGLSLDDLPTGDEAVTAVEPSADADATAPGEPSDATNAADSAEPAEPMDVAAATKATDGSDEPDAAAVEPAQPEVDSGPTAESGKPAAEPAGPPAAGKDGASGVAEARAPVEAIAAVPMAADLGLDGIGELPGLDRPAAAVAEASVAAAPAPPPLDMTGVETAATLAEEAFAALAAVSDPGDPARDRLAVAWYRRLAQVGEELVRLEAAAADAGRPLAESPVAATAVLEQVCASDGARKDLERLGMMWLTKQKQRADGVALLVTLDSAKRVGPYWITKASVADGRGDGGDRTVAVISRLGPPVEAGERVVISGVLFDGDTIWAADMRPVDRSPEGDFGVEPE